eukprot:g2042.t1
MLRIEKDAEIYYALNRSADQLTPRAAQAAARAKSALPEANGEPEYTQRCLELEALQYPNLKRDKFSLLPRQHHAKMADKMLAGGDIGALPASQGSMVSYVPRSSWTRATRQTLRKEKVSQIHSRIGRRSYGMIRADPLRSEKQENFFEWQRLEQELPSSSSEVDAHFDAATANIERHLHREYNARHGYIEDFDSPHRRLTEEQKLLLSPEKQNTAMLSPSKPKPWRKNLWGSSGSKPPSWKPGGASNAEHDPPVDIWLPEEERAAIRKSNCAAAKRECQRILSAPRAKQWYEVEEDEDTDDEEETSEEDGTEEEEEDQKQTEKTLAAKVTDGSSFDVSNSFDHTTLTNAVARMEEQAALMEVTGGKEQYRLRRKEALEAGRIWAIAQQEEEKMGEEHVNEERAKRRAIDRERQRKEISLCSEGRRGGYSEEEIDDALAELCYTRHRANKLLDLEWTSAKSWDGKHRWRRTLPMDKRVQTKYHLDAYGKLKYFAPKLPARKKILDEFIN